MSHVQRAVHGEATPPPSEGLQPSMRAVTWKMKDSTITDNDLAVLIDIHIVPGNTYFTAEGI